MTGQRPCYSTKFLWTVYNISGASHSKVSLPDQRTWIEGAAPLVWVRERSLRKIFKFSDLFIFGRLTSKKRVFIQEVCNLLVSLYFILYFWYLFESRTYISRVAKLAIGSLNPNLIHKLKSTQIRLNPNQKHSGYEVTELESSFSRTLSELGQDKTRIPSQPLLPEDQVLTFEYMNVRGPNSVQTRFSC